MTNQTAERLPDEVRDAANQRIAELGCTIHGDDQPDRLAMPFDTFDAALLVAYAAGRSSVLDLLREVTDELEYVSKATCWSGNFNTCVNGGCIHRRALIARARTQWQAVDGAQAGQTDG